MNCLYRFILRHIFRKVIKQGYHHEEDICEIYSLIQEAAIEEFYEDTPASLVCYLEDIHKEAQRIILCGKRS